MPVYVYETVTETGAEQPERFECRQSMRDEPLRFHPVSGRPVRRVITGGLGFFNVRSGGASIAEARGTNCCPGCHD